MTPSTEELLSTARDYWPPTLEAYSSPTSPQLDRLRERWRHQLSNMEPWWEFIDSLQGELPAFIVWDVTATVDASLRCAIYPPKDRRPPDGHWVVVGCMSILAPVYTVYAVRFKTPKEKQVHSELLLDLHSTEQQALADTVSTTLEATFKVSGLPHDVAQTPVPVCVEPRQPPETTLFHALFTGAPQSIP